VSISQPPEPPEVEHRRAAWIQPPEDVVPAVAPVERLLARTPQRAIGLTGIRAYPNGFGFTLHIRLRELIPGEQTNFGITGGDFHPSGEFADYYFGSASALPTVARPPTSLVITGDSTRPSVPRRCCKPSAGTAMTTTAASTWAPGSGACRPRVR
jgi:hypothetical protein